MSPLYWLILALCQSLVTTPTPIHRHGAFAVAVADVITARGPLFKNDVDNRKTVSLMVAVAFRESSLRADAVGDRGRSFCFFQIHDSSGGTDALVSDPYACVDKAYTMLKESIRIDPEHPIAFYARGPNYRSEEAKRISNDRMALAKRLAQLH